MQKNSRPISGLMHCKLQQQVFPFKPLKIQIAILPTGINITNTAIVVWMLL